MHSFSSDEIERYGRQVLAPEWGAAGQERIRAAEVEVRGRGPAAELAVRYLAGAGIGRLVVEDFIDEARAHNPHVAVSQANLVGGLTGRSGVGLRVAGELILGDEDRAAVGAACAVEALKAVLALPHRTRVSVPSL